MSCKPFPWRKVSPAQIDLIDRLAVAGGALPYANLDYRQLVAFAELRKLELVKMLPKARSRLDVALTDSDQVLHPNGYRTTRVVLRITEPQVALLRFLDDGLSQEETSDRSFNELPDEMIDVCRRMNLRGWVERYESWSGAHWSRLAPSGREALAAIDAMDTALKELAIAWGSGRIH